MRNRAWCAPLYTERKEIDMAMQKRAPGNAHEKRNCWQRGNGSYSMRGELRRGISLNKKYLNRKVRHSSRGALRHGEYRRVCKTIHMVDFS